MRLQPSVFERALVALGGRASRASQPGMLVHSSAVTAQKDDALLAPREAMSSARYRRASGAVATVAIIGRDNHMRRAGVRPGC